MAQDNIDVEQEKAKSYELGHISQLESLADELRERAGEEWANSSSRTDTKLAKQLKDLGNEFEERANEKRERKKEKYNET